MIDIIKNDFFAGHTIDASDNTENETVQFLSPFADGRVRRAGFGVRGVDARNRRQEGVDIAGDL